VLDLKSIVRIKAEVRGVDSAYKKKAAAYGPKGSP
jgi:hypothetical protein